MPSSKLQVLNLTTPEDYNCYKNYTNVLDSSNPFSSIELILNNNPCYNYIKYFAFSIENVPKILMVIIVRPIEIGLEKTPYFDVISPYGYSGPLISKSINDEDITTFWNAVDNWYQNNQIVTEFIRFSLNNNHLFYSGTVIPTLNHVKGHILEENLQWIKFKKKGQKQFSKSD